MKFLRQIYESLIFALQALRSNLLRTVLSLLGVTVGIFSIIAVFTFVDSMNGSIKAQLEGFGKGTIYVTKWPWSFDFGGYPWWKYVNRPKMKWKEYKFLEENLTKKQAVAISDGMGGVTVKFNNNSFQLSFLDAFTYEYNQMEEVVLDKGRYYYPQEMESARYVTILGYEVANSIFPEGFDPVGQTIKLKGINFLVIGVAAKKGKDPLGIGGDIDSKAMIPYQTFAKLFQGSDPDPNVVVKALATDVGEQELEGEIKGLLRSYRGIKPIDDDNFSINRIDGATKFFDSLFASLKAIGFIIGLFSALIGGFGIANIMFVSVQERINIIGIQKSLGAKNYFILGQFLFEAVLLCLIGGMIGLMIVWSLTFLTIFPFDLTLSASNIILGLSMASIIGLIFGILPAMGAARMNPVDAIRAK